MAEMLYKKYASKCKSSSDASSAGLYAMSGHMASDNAIIAMDDYGIDLSRHRSRRVSAEMLPEFDMIVCMTKAHAEAIRSLYPEHGDKTTCLSDRDISDPYGGTLYTYKTTAEEIWSAVQKLPV